MTAVLTVDRLAQLPRTPASDVKRLGWRGVMRTVGREGKVLVTNHDRPEAVILSTDEYERLAQAAQAQQTATLDALRSRFDQRLSALAEDDAADKLRAVLAEPAALQAHVKVGEGH